MEQFNQPEILKQPVKDVENEPQFTEEELRLFEEILNAKDIEVDLALKLEPFKADIIFLIRRNQKNGINVEKIKEIASNYVDKILARIEKN